MSAAGGFKADGGHRGSGLINRQITVGSRFAVAVSALSHSEHTCGSSMIWSPATKSGVPGLAPRGGLGLSVRILRGRTSRREDEGGGMSLCGNVRGATRPRLACQPSRSSWRPVVAARRRHRLLGRRRRRPRKRSGLQGLNPGTGAAGQGRHADHAGRRRRRLHGPERQLLHRGLPESADVEPAALQLAGDPRQDDHRRTRPGDRRPEHHYNGLKTTR